MFRLLNKDVWSLLRQSGCAIRQSASDPTPRRSQNPAASAPPSINHADLAAQLASRPLDARQYARRPSILPPTLAQLFAQRVVYVLRQTMASRSSILRSALT